MSFLLIMILIIFDIISGGAVALYNKDFSSKVMRKGLYHKSAEVGLLTLSYLIDYGVNLILPNGNYGDFSVIITTYLFVMEVYSIYENLKKINPDLDNDEINGFVSTLKHKKEGDDNENKSL